MPQRQGQKQLHKFMSLIWEGRKVANRETIVTEVNADLRAQRADAIGHRENPRIIALLTTLLRLTNTAEDNDKLDAENPVQVCAHEVINRKTGKCVACGQVPEETYHGEFSEEGPLAPGSTIGRDLSRPVEPADARPGSDPRHYVR